MRHVVVLVLRVLPYTVTIRMESTITPLVMKERQIKKHWESKTARQIENSISISFRALFLLGRADIKRDITARKSIYYDVITTDVDRCGVVTHPWFVADVQKNNHQRNSNTAHWLFLLDVNIASDSINYNPINVKWLIRNHMKLENHFIIITL